VTVRALIAAGLLVTLVPAMALSAPPETRRPAAKLVHEVQRGETLSVIAKRYRVTVVSIVIANRLRGPRARLQGGELLTIPRLAPPAVATRRTPALEPLPVSLVLGVPELDDPPTFQWPVVGQVSSTYGRRHRSWHRGIDIAVDAGTPIVASAAGVVIASGVEPRYGQMVKIEHDGGFMTVYAHNERNLVEVGQEVAAGQVIALVGRTGRATADHVHFEIRHDGRVYNPLYLLPLPPRFVLVEPALGAPHDDDD
jgi:murein DD-endopeptidase MepM/ murein hydrolase activator NlpD